MIHSDLFGPGMLKVPLATALAISTVLGAWTALAQGQPPRSAPMPGLSEAEKARRLAERDRYEQEANRLAEAGKFAESIGAFEKKLGIEREVLGPLRDDVVRSLEAIAKLQGRRENWAAARKTLAEVLAIRQRQPDRKDWRIADARRSLADLNRRAELEPAERRRLYEAEQQMRLGITHYSQGKYAEGVGPCRTAMQIRGELLGEDHPDYATSLHNLALLYQAMGDYAKAEPLARQALAIRKRVLGENHAGYAQSLNNLAGLCLAMGDYAQAEPLYKQALDITKRVLGENHPDYASNLNSLAVLYEDMGDYAQAEPLHKQALGITKRVLGENHPNYATSLKNLARLYEVMGHYAKAEALSRQALAIVKRVLGENHPNYAVILNNLAALYQAMGDYAKAEPLFRQALEINKRVLGENHPNYANILNNLAALYRDMGEYAKAEPLCREAKDIYKRALGENHPYYAAGLNNLAELYAAKGSYGKAEPLYLRALEITKQVLGENHPRYATNLHSLARLYEAMGDYANAEPLYRQALEIRKRVAGENHPEYAKVLSNLAGLYYSQGELRAAEKCLSQALTLLTRWTQVGLTTLGERLRLQLLVKKSQALDFYLSIAPAAGIKAEELYHHVLNWKGVVEVHQDEDHLARDRPELKETLEQLKRARTRLAYKAFTVPPAAQRQAWVQQPGALRERMENLDSDLARESGAFRRLEERRRINAAQVAEELPPGSVLVDLLDYEHFSPPAGGKGRLGRERRLLAFVLRRGQAPVLVPLGASRPIDQLVRDWRKALETRTPEPMVAAARELSRRVWDPLKPHLEGATRVVVAPDGTLMYFPLAALPGSRPGAYLLENVTVSYVSSAHRLAETLTAPREARTENREAKARGLLAIGGIDYRADPGGAAPSDTAPTPGVLLAESQRAGFKALAGTEPEARRIGQLFGATFCQEQALVLTGAEPTEAAVKHELTQRRRYLHLATHGFFESPARVAALRAGLKSDGFGLAGVGSSEESAALALSPLLHSGLALAGAARKTEAAEPGATRSLAELDDGILTAEEVQSLDIRGAELVVLSACETGLGPGHYGQGVLGLQRAFHAAGARAVVASLWKVDDAATSVLMEQFYTNLWVKKMSKLEALRQSQLAVLNNPGLVRARRAELVKRGIGETSEKLPAGGSVPAPSAAGARSDPSLWAAFVLSGDGR
jgi:CHAT domain-containing protein/Tfp pilus assembly protein PilF